MVRVGAVFLILISFSGISIRAQANSASIPSLPSNPPVSTLSYGADTASPPATKHEPVPTKQDLEIKERLEALSHLTDEQLTAELHKWPRYLEMSIGERGKFLQRIQELRDHRRNVAMARAKELNLALPTPELQAAFEKSFWEKKLKAENELWQEIEPRRKVLDEQMDQQLLKEFAADVKKPTN